MIRTHGDYHLGQTLHSPRGWVVIDFEGEPARPCRSPSQALGVARRRQHAPLVRLPERDGRPDERRRAQNDFEGRARAVFLDAYFSHVDPSLLPAGEVATENLLSIFELERAIYELHYEVEHRPDWVSIPVAGISRLLESS